MAEPDVLGALARRRQEHLRRRAVAVLLEEVVLHFPHAVQPQPIGQLDLLEGVAQQLLLRPRRVRPRQLVLIKQPEAHAHSILHLASSLGRRRFATPKKSSFYELTSTKRARLLGSHWSAAGDWTGRGAHCVVPRRQ